MRLSPRHVPLALLLGGLLLASTAAHAEPTASDKETARKLIDQGRARDDAKDLKGALDAFKAADEILRAPITAVMVANAQVNLGRLVEARETLARVLKTPKAPDEPAGNQRARKAAEELDADLDARMPALRIDVRAGGAADATASVDEVKVPVADLKAPYRLNPGHHVVVAHLGTRTARQEVDVAEHETKDVVLDLAPAAPAPAPAPAPASRSTSTLTYVGFGVAGVGVIAGSVTGILMFSKKSDVEGACTPEKQCPPSAHDALSSAYTMATISTISFIVAGVGATVGIVGLLSGRSSAATAATTRTVIEPWAGVGAGGLRGSF